MGLVLYSYHLPCDGQAISQIGELSSRKLSLSFQLGTLFYLSCYVSIWTLGLTPKKAGRGVDGQRWQWGGTTDFCGTVFSWKWLWKADAMWKKGSVRKGNEEVIHVVCSGHTTLGVQFGGPFAVAGSSTGACKASALGLCSERPLRDAHFCPLAIKSRSSWD